jgi:hypothetical protein
MKFPRLYGRAALVLCAAFVFLTVGTQTVSAASLPTLGTRLYYMLGSFLRGGMVSTASSTSDTTSVAGYWDVLPEFNSATTLKSVTSSITSGYAYKGTFNAYVRGTGSTTIRYGASCFPNPLAKISGGSGTVLRLTYQAGNNPAGVGGDIGFVKSCTAHTGATASGSDLIDNTCTSTGCVSQYTTGTASFNNVDYIKFTPRANLTSSYTGRITFELLNDWGK